jgi:hypothetical protein
MLVALAAAQTPLWSMLGGYLLGKETSFAHGNQVVAFVFIDLGEVKDGEALPVVAGETAAHEVGLACFDMQTKHGGKHIGGNDGWRV